MEEAEEMTNEEVLDLYIEQQKLHSTEGTRGVDNLTQICQALGYDRNGQYVGSGHALINFLADNPGAIEAVIEFIRDHAECYESINDDMRYDLDVQYDD